jgi:hypothetical protein
MHLVAVLFFRNRLISNQTSLIIGEEPIPVPHHNYIILNFGLHQKYIILAEMAFFGLFKGLLISHLLF